MNRVAALLLCLVVHLHDVIIPVPVHCERLHLALAFRPKSARLARLGLCDRAVVDAVGLVVGPVAAIAPASHVADAAALRRRDALVHALFGGAEEPDFELLHALEELALAEHLLHVDVGEDIFAAECQEEEFVEVVGHVEHVEWQLCHFQVVAKVLVPDDYFEVVLGAVAIPLVDFEKLGGVLVA